MPDQFSSAVKQELAPTGVMRVAINTGNPVLAKKSPTGAAPSGISVDLAQELGQRLDLSVHLIPFSTAGDVFVAMEREEWDVAFLAIEPVRAEKIAFTSPYVVIEGTYLVRAASHYVSATEMDAPGIKIGVGLNAAYDLFLSRTLNHAELVRAIGHDNALELFRSGKVDALAGVRQALDMDAAKNPGTRVLADRFMAIHQAMATPKARSHAADYLQAYINDVRSSGFVKAVIAKNHQSPNIEA